MYNITNEKIISILDEHDSISSNELLVVDKPGPPGGQQVPPGGPTVYVPELVGLPVDISHGESLHRGIASQIQRREDRISAESRDGEPSAIVRVALCQHLGERRGGMDNRRWWRGGMVADGYGWVKRHDGVNLVGIGIGEEVHRCNGAEEERTAEIRRGEIGRRGGALFEMTFWEIVDKRTHVRRTCWGTSARAPHVRRNLRRRRRCWRCRHHRFSSLFFLCTTYY